MFFKKKNEVQQLKSTRPRKIIRGIVIVFMVFVLLRGVTSVLRPNSATTAAEIIQTYNKDNDYRQKVEFEASSFAKMFIAEYFTYDTTQSNDDNYIQKLSKYTNIEFPQPPQRAKTEALNVEAYRVEWRNQKVNVDCKVKIRSTATKQAGLETSPGTNPATPAKSLDEVYVRIPVAENNGKYIIEGYPLFLSNEDRAEGSRKNIDGQEVNEDTKKDVVSMLESFLKAYCTGSSTEIAYFLQDSIEIKGLNGQFKFKELKENDLQIKEKGGQYLVSATFTVINAAGMEFLQGAELSLIQKDKKYLILKYNAKI